MVKRLIKISIFLLPLIFISCDNFNGMGGYPGYLAYVVDLVDVSDYMETEDTESVDTHVLGTFTHPVTGEDYYGLIQRYSNGSRPQKLILFDKDLQILQTINGAFGSPERWAYGDFTGVPSQEIVTGTEYSVQLTSFNVVSAPSGLNGGYDYIYDAVNPVYGINFSYSLSVLNLNLQVVIDSNKNVTYPATALPIDSSFDTSFSLALATLGQSFPTSFDVDMKGHLKDVSNGFLYVVAEVDASPSVLVIFQFPLGNIGSASDPSPYIVIKKGDFDDYESSPVSISDEKIVVKANSEMYAQIIDFSSNSVVDEIDLEPILGDLDKMDREYRRQTTYSSDGKNWFVYDPYSLTLYKLDPWW